MLKEEANLMEKMMDSFNGTTLEQVQEVGDKYSTSMPSEPSSKVDIENNLAMDMTNKYIMNDDKKGERNDATDKPLIEMKTKSSSHDLGNTAPQLETQKSLVENNREELETHSVNNVATPTNESLYLDTFTAEGISNFEFINSSKLKNGR